MKFEERRDAAIDLLEKAGIWRSNYKPPILRMLWRFGLGVRPPHFASFIANFIISGVGFGVIWGLAMWFGFWSPQGMAIPGAAFTTVIAGLLFGLVMAAYYRFGARKHGLPKWSDIEGPTASDASDHMH